MSIVFISVGVNIYNSRKQAHTAINALGRNAVATWVDHTQGDTIEDAYETLGLATKAMKVQVDELYDIIEAKDHSNGMHPSDVASWKLPNSGMHLYTGGMSGGDSPNESFDTIFNVACMGDTVTGNTAVQRTLEHIANLKEALEDPDMQGNTDTILETVTTYETELCSKFPFG